MGGRCVTYLVPVFSVILIENLVLTCKSIQRLDEKTGIVTECCKTNCTSGSYVEVCTVNGTDDQCVPCPHDSYLDDNTSSDLPTPCIQYNCPPGSVPANTFPKSGCHKKCQCDVTQKYVGTDPCDCKKSSVTCTRGKQLTIHNVCSTITTTETLMPLPSVSGQTVSTTPEEVGPEMSTVIVTGGNTTPTEDKEPILTVLGGVGVAVLLVVVLVVTMVFIYQKRKRRLRQEISQQEDQIELDPLRRNLDSRETDDRIVTREHSGEINSDGRLQCNGGQETTSRMGVDNVLQENRPGFNQCKSETIQNGDVHIPLVKLPSQRSNTEETEEKKLVSDPDQTLGDQSVRDPLLEQISTSKGITDINNGNSTLTSAKSLGNTIGLSSCPSLDPKSIEGANDIPNSIKLRSAPSLNPNSMQTG
ncbi:uncharacterized protein LOC133191354 [Saccostrea echinata]|uniref:uncharacterized protein LOC133191354 n=1 Tax=Saccostrea echinata TaxID=191078 RepID=UPI002A82FB71|nr:uncharacterized protein LOC133191354 [Saccostrea echinata]